MEPKWKGWRKINAATLTTYNSAIDDGGRFAARGAAAAEFTEPCPTLCQKFAPSGFIATDEMVTMATWRPSACSSAEGRRWRLAAGTAGTGGRCRGEQQRVFWEEKFSKIL